MNARFLLPLAAAAALTAGLAANAAVPDSLLGDASQPEQATRTIDIGPGTRWVNVTEGEVVTFRSGTYSFTWRFDAPDTSSFDLQRVAPQGMLDHAVTAYVEHDADHD